MKWLRAFVAAVVVLGVAGLASGPSLIGHLDAAIHAAPPAAPSYGPVAVPVATAATPAPPMSAASWYAVDVASGQALGGHQADTERPIASITKLATALVIVHSHKLGDELTVPPLPAYATEDEILHLTAGERFSTRDLLAALLINSDDDSADALALADSGTEPAFVAKMNHLVGTWGISNAHFSNPSGLVDSGNGASAKAVATLAELVLRNPTLKQLVMTPSTTISDSAGRSFALATTDELLQTGQFQGIKTGYTDAAGQCFVGLTVIKGHPVITVVLGSADRFGDTAKLAAWINQTYQWH